jgi:hypothetical protein
MTGFEYASGLISIVVGLAIARVLGGVGTFLRLDNRTPHDWIVGTWCLVLFLALLGWWMAGWQVLQVQAEISLVTLVFWTSATALLYLSAYLLVPATIVERSGGPETNFQLPGGAFFACLAAHFVLMAVYMTVVFESGLGALVTLAMAIISATGAAIKTNWGYTLHLAVWVAVLFGAALTRLPAIR